MTDWWKQKKSLRRKRLIDVFGAALGLTVCMPALRFFCVGMHRDGGGRYFVQRRPGLQMKNVEIVKVRTLGRDGQVLGNRARLMRQLGLDELPQLWSVLYGEMSLVGPRPLAVECERFCEEQRRRYEVPPGLTGWAQIQGREHLPFSERAKLDVWYVDHQSFGLDVLIITLTPLSLLVFKADREGRGAGVSDDLPQMAQADSPSDPYRRHHTGDLHE